MKLAAGLDWLAGALHEPTLSSELVRALREDCRELVAEERRLSRMASRSGYPFHWGTGGFEKLLHGPHGINGGRELTFQNFAFVLIGSLLDCRRTAVARKTLGMFFAPVTTYWRGWREPATWPPIKEPEEPVKTCPRTGERYFGPALIKALSDRALLDELDEISVSGDLDGSTLEFQDNSVTSFVRWPPGKPDAYYGIRHLPVFVIKPLLLAMTNEDSESTAA